METMPTETTFAHPTIPLWERPWLDGYPRGVPSSLAYPSIPLSGLMEATAQRFPDRPGCTLYGKPTTYAELAQRSQRLAATLKRMGAGPGRRVAMLLPNIPEYLIALQATWLTGATVLQLSPLMVPEELQKWLRLLDCHIVVTLDLLAPNLADTDGEGSPLERVIVTSLAERMPTWKSWLYRVERVRRKGPVRLLETDKIHRFDNLLKPVDGPIVPNVRPEEDVAVMVPTGGTTGSPKVVMLTHKNLVANATQLRYWSLSEEGKDNVLAVLPFFHAYGLSVCALSSLATGATVHLHPRFEAEAVLNIIEREKIQLLPAVPAMLNALNRSLRKRPRDLSSIRAVISGASALSAATRDEFQSYGAQNVVEGYGLSEASPVTHANPLGGASRVGSIGLPLPDTEARIVDEATGTKEMPVGEAGELIIRGPQVMKGYFNNPEETAIALRDGWLYTGDIAQRDKDGYFKIVDRKKDIIKMSGFLVFPAEVEEAINKFPGVAETAVVGEIDESKGEVVVAYVVPENGTLDMAGLQQHCLDSLSKQKRPKRINVVRELPKNFLGKIQRRKVREASQEEPKERAG